MKKVLIISTSIRNKSNSEIIAREFEKGAKEAGHDVEFVSLKKKEINYCIGCFACLKTKKCFMNDGASEIVDKMFTADVIAFATPIYSNQMCGQMKTLMDRTNPIYPLDYSFREIYLLTTAAETAENVPDGAINGVQGWIDCFPKCSLKGVIRGVGINEPGEASEKAQILKQAYEMGKNI